METETKPIPRYRNITEKSRSLLFLLREIPYITSSDIRRFYYAGNKSRSYSLEMVGVLLKNKLVHKFMLGDGVFIYYLTYEGKRMVDYFLLDKPKYHEETRSFYYSRPPLKPSEINPFFIFPATNLLFHPFTPHFLAYNPLHHTRSLLELYYLLRNAYRFLYVVWLDKVKEKKTALNITCFPDLLLTNDLGSEGRRIFIEFENSRINHLRLLDKLNRLTAHPADYYLLLASSPEIFQNLGRLIRKILLGEAKQKTHTIFFSPRTQAALGKQVLIGEWLPSHQNSGVVQKLRDLTLHRYDSEVFDKRIWANEVKDGIPVKDSGGAVIKKEQTVPYPSRKQGQKTFTMVEILALYVDDFNRALDGVLCKNPRLETHEGKKAA